MEYVGDAMTTFYSGLCGNGIMQCSSAQKVAPKLVTDFVCSCSVCPINLNVLHQQNRS